MDTLLLDPVAWDLLLDASGNIALAQDPYSIAQDAASAIRLFLGELYYDTTKGVPYWASILGQSPPLALVKAKLVAAAMTVPEVVAAQVFITGVSAQRIITGQVQVTTVAGVIVAANF